MPPAQFQAGLRDFAATLDDANQLVGHLNPRGRYRPYGRVLRYPGVAALIDGLSVLGLCKLAVKVGRDKARRAESPGLARIYVQRAFAVQVRARTLYARRQVQGMCRSPRPRRYRPRRVRVSRGPRKARAPGDPDPEPELAAPQPALSGLLSVGVAL